MNGSDVKTRAIIDTNIIFMALYHSESKAGRVIQLALQSKIKLFSTDSVKEELSRVLEKEMKLKDDDIKKIISSLPIVWINKEIYKGKLNKTKVKHKADKPIEALSLILGIGILTADKKFAEAIKNKIINVNELLGKLEKTKAQE